MLPEMTLIKTALTAGVWQGEMHGGGDAPELTVTHLGETLPGLELSQDGSIWHIRFAIPAGRIADGVQTFVFSNAADGAVLASFALLAGEALDEDIRAEMDLMRAELDILKKAFRRHCVETGA